MKSSSSNRLWSMLILLSAAAGYVYTNEVIGCGGFIKSNTEINYKIIKVKLLTKDGAVKYTTEASPVNGYYMIPIYNKGDYVLQVNPPLGWSFEPSQVSISVDGKTDACSKNEDVNFFFKGFGLSGKIVTKGDSTSQGPSGVKLLLIQNGKQIGTSESGNDGSYYFSNIMPGSYQVEAQDPTLKFIQNKVNVELSKDNWYAQENIVVSGYKIEGTVMSADKTPISDAIVELHFADQSLSNIDTKSFECTSSRNGLKICEVRSDASGRFLFSNIAFGRYKLHTKLAHNSLVFGMRPSSIDVDLTKHKNIKLAESFQLDHVSVESIALLSDKTNKPLTNGEVFLNGKKQADIGKDGKFSLGKLTSGSYKIEIKSKNADAHFEVKTVRVDLSNWSAIKSDTASSLLGLLRFQAKSFDVCGRVKINNANLASNLVQSVRVKVYSTNDNSLVKSTSLRSVDDLTYCVELDAGREYVVKAELSDSLAQLLRLVPLEKRISVIDSSILDVDFEQLEARLDGQIRLIAGKSTAPQDIKVVLRSVESNSDWSKEILVKCVQVKDGPIECSFSQSKLLFGKYELTTNYDDVYCWKSSNSGAVSGSKQLTINIDSESQMVRIEQAGYKLNLKLSHGGVHLKLIEPAKQNSVLFSRNILAQSNELVSSVCLPELATYRLEIDSCHKFTRDDPSSSSSSSIEITPQMLTRGSNTLDLIAQRHKLTIRVVFKITDPNDATFLRDSDLTVEAKSETQNELIKFKLETSTSDELVFSGHSWFEANKQVRLVAKSDKVLFETNDLSRIIDENECNSNVVVFHAKMGIFIVGSFSPIAPGAPPIDSISVEVRSTSDDSVVIDKLTVGSANGFKLGPYKAPVGLYAVHLAKSGYLFAKITDQPNPKEKNVYELKYQVEKLGQLKVSVLDGKQKSPLESVLMSLSSENRQFRQTIKTDSQGHVTFDSLKPGLYYLIVMMQEYEFKPNSHPIEIRDGADVGLVVEANRIAYSCFGRVTSINGRSESEGAVLVEAHGVRSELDVNLEHDLCKSSRENAELDTDGLGTYRIRNLKPNCVYELSVKRFREGTDGQLRIVPSLYSFRVNESDVLDRNFIVLARNEQVDVSVSVSIRHTVDERAVSQFARVKLFRINQPDNILGSQLTSVNSVVYFGSVTREEAQQYAVSVELLAPSPNIPITSSLTSQQQQQVQQLPIIDKTELSFYADSKHKHLQVKFDSDKRRSGGFSDFKQQYQTFYFTVPLFVIAIAIFLNGKKSKDILTSLVQSLQQPGGLLGLIDGLRGGNAAQTGGRTDSGQQMSASASQSKSNKSAASKSPRLRDAKSTEAAKPKPVVSPVVPEPIVNESNNEDSEDYEADYTSEEGESLTIVKRKPKKI